MWGKSDNGQLGIGVNQINVPTPTLLSSLSVKGNPVVSVAACSDKCYAVLGSFQISILNILKLNSSKWRLISLGRVP